MLLTSTDPEGNVTTYEYDANNRLALIRDPLLHETTIQYDGRGIPSRITDPLGNAIEMISDTAGRIVQTTDALGNDTRAAYNALNQLTKITDALAGETTLTGLSKFLGPLLFGLAAIVFGIRSLVEFVLKPFAAELPFTKALTWALGTCLMVMLFYEVGSVWITILAPSDLSRQQTLMKMWIGSSFAGFLVYAFIPSMEKKLRRR